MIKEVNKNNLSILDNSFLDINTVKEDLENNAFGRYIVLLENNEIIGYIYYSEIYERVEINQFEVRIDKRNCGKGKELLKHLITATNKDITLEVKEDNVKAICLYKSFDFKEVAIRKGYYNGIDGILMERKKKTL